MAKEFSRIERVDEQLQRELAKLIQLYIKDPALGMVTVSTVKTSKDLRQAKVYVTTLAGSASESEAVSLLKKSAKMLRHELAKILTMKNVPELRFYYDESIDRGRRMESLLDSIPNSNQTGSNASDEIN